MSKKGIVVPSEKGARGIPPGVGSKFPKGKNRGIVVPATMGDMGKPRSSYPGSGKMDPRLD